MLKIVSRHLRPTNFRVLELPYCLPPRIFGRLSAVLVRFSVLAATNPSVVDAVLDEADEILRSHGA